MKVSGNDAANVVMYKVEYINFWSSTKEATVGFFCNFPNNKQMIIQQRISHNNNKLLNR